MARPGPRAAEIARHLRLAGQDDQAVSYLVRAAQDARVVAAMAEAASFLTEALQIGPDDPELLVELAEVEAFRGLLDDSDRAFDRALEQTAPQDAGALISAWLRRGRWLRGGVCHPRESRRSYQNALDVLDRDPGYDRAARAEALAGLAWAEAVAGDPAAVEELLAETDRILESGSPGDLLAHDIGVARGHALIRAGQFTGCFAPLIAASAAASRAGRPDMAYSCLSNAASARPPASSAARWTSPTAACPWSSRTACSASASTRRQPGPRSCAGWAGRRRRAAPARRPPGMPTGSACPSSTAS
jgi:tetratricopeptide (TPR) repeat protein